MASMLLRASRDAARAAPLAALVASRCSAVAASGAGSVGAAASNRLLRRFPIASLSRGLSSDRHDVPVTPPAPYNYYNFYDQRNVEYFANTMDIKSDKDLWKALYERWCKTFGEEERYPKKEMRRLFKEFKDTVLFVDRSDDDMIKCGFYVRYAVRKTLDGKRFDLMAFKVPSPPITKIFLRAGKDLGETTCLPWSLDK